jgi:1-acyl-sn-glycerol-3-phosphate acyltransferase
LCANHVSWLDIGVLSACLPVAFVARADLARWPLIGHFAWLQGAIFVDRTRRAATVATSRAMAARLRTGRAVVLFPEGTSTDGARVAPFRASLLAAARDAADGSASPASAQPVAIAYVGRRGVPMGRRERPTYAWYGDMELAPHVPKVLASGVVEVTVAFGAPVEVGPGTDRKRLAASLEREVRTMLHEALTGRRGNVAPGG